MTIVPIGRANPLGDTVLNLGFALVAGALIAVLIGRELLKANASKRMRPWLRRFGLGIAPLLLCFGGLLVLRAANPAPPPASVGPPTARTAAGAVARSGASAPSQPPATGMALAPPGATVRPSATVAPTTTPSPSPLAPVANLGQTYRQAAGAFALSYPAGWQVVGAESNAVHLVRGDSAGTISLRLLYLPTLPPGVADSAALWTALQPQIRATVTKFQVIAAGQPVRLGNQPAYGVTATWSTDGTAMSGQFSALVYDGHGYLLQQVGPSDQYARDIAPGLNEIARTIQLPPPAR